jgi:hypothetical protein
MLPHQCAILREFKVRATKSLKYVLDLWSFVVVVKLPDDGTLMPKHVVVHLPWSVFYDLCFIVFHLVDFIR